MICSLNLCYQSLRNGYSQTSLSWVCPLNHRYQFLPNGSQRFNPQDWPIGHQVISGDATLDRCRFSFFYDQTMIVFSSAVRHHSLPCHYHQSAWSRQLPLRHPQSPSLHYTLFRHHPICSLPTREGSWTPHISHNRDRNPVGWSPYPEYPCASALKACLRCTVWWKPTHLEWRQSLSWLK